MTRRTPAPAGQWPRLMVDTSRLWADANMVMMLRTWRMMSGGTAAVTEAERMVGEKLAAGFELAGALAGAAATGRAPTPEAAARKALTVYSRKVKANRRRLG